MKIPALRIEVNGQLVAVAGAENLSLLTATIGFGSGPKSCITAADVMLGVMGLNLSASQPQQLNWANDIKLKVGDKVTFEIAEVDEASTPDKNLSTPSSAQLRAEAKRK